MREKIKELLEEIEPGIDYEGSDALMDDGIIDSFFTIQLVGKLMEEYGIELDPEEIVSENFNSLDAISDLVKKHGGI